MALNTEAVARRCFFFEKKYFYKFRKIHRKTHVLESLKEETLAYKFRKIHSKTPVLQPLKEEALAQVFSREF